MEGKEGEGQLCGLSLCTGVCRHAEPKQLTCDKRAAETLKIVLLNKLLRFHLLFLSIGESCSITEGGGVAADPEAEATSVFVACPYDLRPRRVSSAQLDLDPPP